MFNLVNIKNLIDDANKQMQQGTLCPKYSLESICNVMDFDYNKLYYTDPNDVFKQLSRHKLLEWNKLDFVITQDKATSESVIVFFKYKNKYASSGHQLGERIKFCHNGDVLLDGKCICSDLDLISNIDYIVEHNLIKRTSEDFGNKLELRDNSLFISYDYEYMKFNDKIIDNECELITSLKEFFVVENNY